MKQAATAWEQINSNQLKSTCSYPIWRGFFESDPHRIHTKSTELLTGRGSRGSRGTERLRTKSRLLLTDLWAQVVRSTDCSSCDGLQGSKDLHLRNRKLLKNYLKTFENHPRIQDHPMLGNASNSPLTASLNPDESSRFHSLASCPHAAKVLDCPKELNCIQLCQTNNCQVPPNKRSSPGSPSSPSACVELRTLAMPKSPIFKLPRSVPCRFQS